MTYDDVLSTLKLSKLRWHAARFMRLPLVPWIKGTVEGVGKTGKSVLKPVRRGSERI